MVQQYAYKWLSYNLNVGCKRCANRMVFQSPSQDVECKECGFKEKYSWKDVLEYAEVENLKYKEANKTIMGAMDIKCSQAPVEHIHCYHCKAVVKIAPDTDITSAECQDCKKPLSIEKVTEKIIFYAYVNVTGQGGPPAMIAVKCVSCGAPLEADPTKTNYHCRFCGTENILPLAMRYNVVLNDTFLGIRERYYQKDLAFTGTPEDILKAIRQEGVDNFTQEEIDTIVKNNLSLSQVYFEFYGKGKRISKEVEEEIFRVSKHRQQIIITGQQTGKSQEEINARLEELNPPPKPAPAKKPEEKKGFFKRLFG